MNVLVFHSELGVLRGGGENFTRNLFAAFAARGHRVAAVFVAGPRGAYPFPLPAGVEPVPLRGWWSRNPGQRLLFALDRRFPHAGRLGTWRARLHDAVSWRAIRWHNRRFARRALRAVDTRLSEFDSIYVHGDVELAAAVSGQRPTILRLPGPPSADHGDLLRRIPVVCANGDALVRARAVVPDRVAELPLGIDARLFTPTGPSARQRFGWSDADAVVGYVGRLTHLKGVDLLAAAFRSIASSRPDVRLLIVGQGPAEGTIRSVLAPHIARGAVRLEPDVAHERLPDWYRAMDLLVMPSRYENCSNAIVEALACGIPFLAANVGGNAALADATGGGWICDADSEAALAGSLAGILREKEELTRRGRAAAGQVSGRYSWTRSAELLESLFVSRLGAGR